MKDFVQDYAPRESDAVTLIEELLTGAGKSIDVLMAKSLEENLDYVERVDPLTTIAEGRRNASLREIERRLPVFSETLPGAGCNRSNTTSSKSLRRRQPKEGARLDE